jgi:hypothetical protein
VRLQRSHAPLYNNQASAAEVTPSGSRTSLPHGA